MMDMGLSERPWWNVECDVCDVCVFWLHGVGFFFLVGLEHSWSVYVDNLRPSIGVEYYYLWIGSAKIA